MPDRRPGFFLPIFCVLFLSGTFALAGGPDDSSRAGISPQRILILVNGVRAAGCNCGGQWQPPAPPVAWNARLEKAAYKHVSWIKQKGVLSHTGRGGATTGRRIETEGYRWQACAENIARGYKTEEDVVAGWLRSEGHCRNLMNPTYTEMGVAVSGDYWTQVFAQPF